MESATNKNPLMSNCSFSQNLHSFFFLREFFHIYWFGEFMLQPPCSSATHKTQIHWKLSSTTSGTTSWIFFFGQSNYFSTTVNKHNFGIYYPSQLLFSLTAVLSDGQFVHCSPAESFPSCSSMVQFSHEKEKQTKKKPKPKPDSRIHCCDVGRFQQN